MTDFVSEYMSSASRVSAWLGLAFLGAIAATAAASGEPVEIARGMAPGHPQQPQVAVDGGGAIHVVFGVGDTIRYCRSDDGGRSFSPPVSLPPVKEMSLGMRRGPRLAVSEATVCVTAIGGKQGRGRDGDVLALHSADGGKTWSEPVRVNDAADSAREGLHAMSAGPGAELCCVWLDLRNRKTEVMASVSQDAGRTWSKNVLVYKSPDGSVCECCHPSVVHDGEGAIHVMWRNSLAGKRDMFAATSTDGGTTFGPARKLGSGTWPLKACPMDGGAVAALAPGKLASVWRREKSIFLALDGQDDERLLGPGEQPWIAAAEEGVYVVWLSQRGGAAQLLTPGGKTPLALAAQAADPVVASGPAGRGPVVAAWESREGGHHTIQVQVVSQ